MLWTTLVLQPQAKKNMGVIAKTFEKIIANREKIEAYGREASTSAQQLR